MPECEFSGKICWNLRSPSWKSMCLAFSL